MPNDSQHVTSPTNPVVLKNKGIPADFYVLKKNAAGEYIKPYTREWDDANDCPLTERRWIRFTNSVLASIEEPPPLGWDSVEKWQEASTTQAFKTLTRTFALTFDLWTTGHDGVPEPDWRLAGELMVDGAITQYLLACTYSVLLAQGMDPTKVGDSLRKNLKETLRGLADFDLPNSDEDSILIDPATGTVIPGETGSKDGSTAAGVLTSSGT